jgi:hypothetical protein
MPNKSPRFTPTRHYSLSIRLHTLRINSQLSNNSHKFYLLLAVIFNTGYLHAANRFDLREQSVYYETWY